MAKRKDNKDNQAKPDQAASVEPAANGTPDKKTALPQLDLLNVESPPTAPAPAVATSDTSEPVAAKVETAKSRKDRAAASATEAPTATALVPLAMVAEDATQTTRRPLRAKRFALLAASVAASAALGGLAGALTVGTFTTAPARSDAPALEERVAMQKTLAHLASELAAVKVNLDTANKLSATQFGRVNERLDRSERAQADPAQRLAKISEALDRLEHRAALATPTPETTGSIAPPRTPVAATASVEAKDQTKPIVDGWSIRDARNGQVLVQSRSGIYEVVPGADLPGLGKVETIKRQDGRWIVVTQKGLITARVTPPRPRPGYFLDDF
ncbi:MAG TPA: hypothetical protein VFB45_08580 [Pseudolabrys sp.]|nr:hypothetical protein [Pseudolabrys sp.]